MNDLLNKNQDLFDLEEEFEYLPEGAYAGTLKSATVSADKKTLTLNWEIEGIMLKQTYYSKDMLKDHIGRFAEQNGMPTKCSPKSLVGQEFKVYYYTKIGTNGTPFKNIVPANQPKEIEVEEETF